MRFLTLYTPSSKNAGPPSAEHMAEMQAYMERSFASGELIAAGGILKRETGGFRGTLKNGEFALEGNPGGESVLLGASGYAILEAKDQQDLARMIEEFLRLAGEGQSEIIQLMDMPPQP
jgi:hypothetical protein